MDAKETSVYTAILITSIVIGTIIIYFVISIIRQQRRNLELHKLNILAEITTLENERSRMASDLHDELGPMLSAVKMKINSFELTDPEDHIQLDKTNRHIDDILKRVREISFNLMPSTLLRKGLVITVKELIEHIGNKELKVDFISDSGIHFHEQKTVNIYRIIQEIIYNTLKHARATQLCIEIKIEKEKLILLLQDDGIGFNYTEKLKNGSGLGLRNLLSRTEVMNGKMFLESQEGRGTTYIFEIPLS